MTTSKAAPARRRSRRAAHPQAAQPAQPAQAIAAGWCVGTVCECGPAGFTVLSGALRRSGQRAVSCLLEPRAGDSVACLQVAPDELWILAVLQREGETPHVLQLRGDTQLQVDGRLSLAAPQLCLRSDQLEVRAREARVALDSAELTGRHLSVVGSVVKLVGSVLSTVMDRVSHYSRHHVRTTEGTDRVAATHVECEARQLLRLSGEHTLVNGEKLVKTRGGQIHFG
ncbi:DUF3540 domain-containing protein [Variovorax sp.]|jgi:Protein of unknown function (DUF3540)|uniref:DUF3540 domain-containing protein n=1 Tax=Variovorax sp. TaxID=1871043 RepID=UPI0025DF9E33|nr:DUF3540 domain-containing protein [Variovorax sp.]